MNKMNGPVRIGIGGPVGAGKTSLTAALARRLSERYSIGVITNDIYTREDAEALMRLQILPEDRVIGVETGGCPHTAIREDASINLSAIAELEARHPEIEIVMIESGGDNLSATFSPELADLTVYVIDVAAGAKQHIIKTLAPQLRETKGVVIGGSRCYKASWENLLQAHPPWQRKHIWGHSYTNKNQIWTKRCERIVQGKSV